MTCLIEADGGESSEFCNQAKKMAARQHKCNECGRTIVAGELYEYISGKWDGVFMVHKTCADCLSMRDAFFCSWCFGLIWDDLREHVYGSYGSIVYYCSGKLTPCAAQKVATLVDNAIELEDEDNAYTYPAMRLYGRYARFRWPFQRPEWMGARMRELDVFRRVLRLAKGVK